MRTTPASTAATSSGGFQLGGTSVTSAPPPAFGSFGAPATSAAPSTSAAASTASAAPATSAPPSFSFGAPAASTAASSASAAPATTSAAPTTTAAAAPKGVTFGTPLTQVHTFSVPSTASTLSTASDSGSVAGSATATGGEKTMSFKELEEVINQWTLLLDEQEKIYLEQATQVNAWDRLLMANSEKIDLVHKAADRIKADQDRMEQELDFIAGQQRELEDILKPLEEEAAKEMGILEGSAANDPLTTDGQRTAIYRTAVELDSQLKGMSDDLKEVIDHINARTEGEGQGDGLESPAVLVGADRDPMSQMCQILNAHMDSIQWLDQTLNAIETKLEDVEKMKKQIVVGHPARMPFM